MLCFVLQDEAVEEKMSLFVPGPHVANLSSSNWKERLASMEKITEVSGEKERGGGGGGEREREREQANEGEIERGGGSLERVFSVSSNWEE